MIDIELIKNVKRVIVHKNCPDGLASAMILHHALPSARIEFVQYGEERNSLQPSEGILFCDMSPPENRVQEFINAKAVVLDHHEGQQNIVELFKKNGSFGYEPGVSGAVLAYKEIWIPIMGNKFEDNHCDLIERFATMVGIVDTWQRHDPNWEEAQSTCCALMFYGPDFFFNCRQTNLPILFQDELEVGRLIYKKRQKRCIQIIENSMIYIMQPGIFEAGIFEDSSDDKIISDVSDTMRQDPRMKNIDICVGFSMIISEAKPNWRYSLRSVNEKINVNLIAKASGGGGHAKAAGMVSTIGLDDPISTARAMIIRGLSISGQRP